MSFLARIFDTIYGALSVAGLRLRPIAGQAAVGRCVDIMAVEGVPANAPSTPVGLALNIQASDLNTLLYGWTGSAWNAFEIDLTDLSSLVIDDDGFIVRDPVAPTKRGRLDVGAVTAGQTRVLSLPDANVDLANLVTMIGSGAQNLSSAATPSFAGVGLTGNATLNDGAALLIRGFGTGTGDVVEEVGATTTEAFRLKVYDETVSPAAVETNLINLPAGSMIVSVQANVESTLTGGGTTVTWSIGTTGDPDKYGSAGFNSIDGSSAADSLAQNSKSTWFGDGSHAFSLSAAAEQLVLTGAATGGAADGDTALTVGSVRVRVIYWQLQALDNAA